MTKKQDVFGGESGRLMREENWGAQPLAEELYSMFTNGTPLTPSKPIESNLDAGQPFSIIRGDDNSQNQIVFRFVRSDGTTQDLTGRDLGVGGSGGGGGAGGAGGGGGGQQQQTHPAKVVTVASRSGGAYGFTGEEDSGQRVEGDVDGFDVPAGTRVILHRVEGGDSWFSFPYPTAMRGTIVSGGPSTYQVKVFPYGDTSTEVSASFPGEVGPKLKANRNVMVIRNLAGTFYIMPPKQQVFKGTVQAAAGSTTYAMELAGVDDPAVTSADQLQIDGADEVPSGSKDIVCLDEDGSYFMQFPVFYEM